MEEEGRDRRRSKDRDARKSGRSNFTDFLAFRIIQGCVRGLNRGGKGRDAGGRGRG